MPSSSPIEMTMLARTWHKPCSTHPTQLLISAKSRSSHGLRNEWYPISGVAFDRPSSLSCFQKAEVFLILCQKQARALNGPMKPLQPKGQLVAHPVGSYTLLVIKAHQHAALKTSIRSHSDFWRCIRSSATFDSPKVCKNGRVSRF